MYFYIYIYAVRQIVRLHPCMLVEKAPDIRGLLGHGYGREQRITPYRNLEVL